METENPSTENTKKEKAPRFDRSDLMSILAVIISLSALAVSIYETGILKKQSALMQAQQKASVWPYLEVSGNYMYSEETEVNYAFKNKGVGPARIESFELLINGETFETYDKLSQFFKDLLPNSTSISVSFSSLGGVVAADETVEVFSLVANGGNSSFQAIRELNFKYKICYCSIYGDCWSLNSEKDETKNGCD